MTESARTMAYAAVAVVSIIAAGAYSTFTAPTAVEGFDLVGKEFYPDFQDPRTATSLRLAAFDADTATARTFMIEQKKKGDWVIPSHFDYPADARERLNKTGNSIIGIKRGPQKATRESEHKDLGVLDPMEEEITEFEGRGKRITMKNAQGDVLVDYIIGEKFKDDGNLYYVRQPGENEVYLAEIDVEVSTKFSDWIEDDLLQLNGGDLRALTVNKFSIDENRGTITGREVNVLKRDKSFDPWVLDGLKEDTEELRKTEIDGMVSALDDLKILAVRPKPKGLNPDLTIQPGMSRGMAQYLQIELQQKGFFISAGEKPMLLANEGNLEAATEAGVVYTLNFGEIFSGSEDEIQFGSDKKKEDKKSEKDGDKKEGDPAAEISTDTKQSRFLFVTAAFDPAYLGDKPTKPEEPKRPEGLKDETPAEDAAKGEKEEGETKSDGEKEPEEDDAAKKAAEEQAKLKAEWAAAESKYKSDLRTYEADLKDYEQNVKDGKKKVDDLNYRFGSWYYVISGESFETLRLARADLVKAKEKKPEEVEPATPNLQGAGNKATPAENAADAGKPVDDQPKPDAGKAEADTPAQEKKSEEPKPAAKAEPAQSTEEPTPAKSKQAEPPKADKPAVEDKPTEQPQSDPPPAADATKPAEQPKSDGGKKPENKGDGK